MSSEPSQAVIPLDNFAFHLPVTENGQSQRSIRERVLETKRSFCGLCIIATGSMYAIISDLLETQAHPRTILGQNNQFSTGVLG